MKTAWKYSSSKTGFIVYVSRFVLLAALFFFLNEAFIGLSTPGNYYVPFLNEQLNYINWLRSSILHSAAYLSNLAGSDSYVKDPFLLKLPSGMGVRMVYSCIGYGVMGVWVAYVITSSGSLKRKLIWAVGGCLFIWMLNCLRVAILLLAMAQNRNFNHFANHHALFNLVAYALVLLMIYLYGNYTKTIKAA